VIMVNFVIWIILSILECFITHVRWGAMVLCSMEKVILVMLSFRIVITILWPKVIKINSNYCVYIFHNNNSNLKQKFFFSFASKNEIIKIDQALS
jgi:hypothetical protein